MFVVVETLDDGAYRSILGCLVHCLALIRSIRLLCLVPNGNEEACLHLRSKLYQNLLNLQQIGMLVHLFRRKVN